MDKLDSIDKLIFEIQNNNVLSDSKKDKQVTILNYIKEGYKIMESNRKILEPFYQKYKKNNG